MAHSCNADSQESEAGGAEVTWNSAVMDPISILKVKRLFKLPKTARIYQSVNLKVPQVKFQGYLKLLFILLETPRAFI